MIKESYQKAIDEFVRRVRKYGDKIESIILFGSVARGEAREDSDIDILIISKGDSFDMQKRISEVVVEILLNTGIYISAKVISTEEYNLMRNINSSFFRNISKEGIVIG
ncbi:nucleotidyltransferase domain-containing protein [Archaeoglobus veneficus]|uniref:DNA polymerase beta domain protein region n=1 Tax=Archaeoglobus veneficus (strain DSM 11195 / SNP6) TaxID=693661 RepID=F2KQD1_ARCVS|nr:nucleotidyltransferase domain-containing protein [Archaeoglobus veneficus]AEA46564.1 DNA polymerase beta domain protein region [Archaeoglobus veneficus SNP6]